MLEFREHRPLLTSDIRRLVSNIYFIFAAMREPFSAGLMSP